MAGVLVEVSTRTDPDGEPVDAGTRLVAELGLTDSCGMPRCSSVRPPLVAWSVMA